MKYLRHCRVIVWHFASLLKAWLFLTYCPHIWQLLNSQTLPNLIFYETVEQSQLCSILVLCESAAFLAGSYQSGNTYRLYLKINTLRNEESKCLL